MTDSPPTPLDTNQIIEERRGKLATLRAAGVAFPNDFVRHHFAGDLQQQFESSTSEALDVQPEHVTVAGRLMLKRVMGKASFATLQDMSGRIQVYVQTDAVGAEVHDAFKHWDLGDILGAEGTLFRTRTGELTVKAQTIRLLS